MPQERESASLGRLHGDHQAALARRRRDRARLHGARRSVHLQEGCRRYTSNASVVIRPILSDPFGDNRIEDVGADTQAKVLDSTVVATTVAKRLKLDKDPKDLVNRLTVENPVGTLILNISFTASTPERAQAGAQAFAQAYLDYRRTDRGGRPRSGRSTELDAQQQASISRSLADAAAAIAANPPGSDAADRTPKPAATCSSRQIGDLETQAAARPSPSTPSRARSSARPTCPSPDRQAVPDHDDLRHRRPRRAHRHRPRTAARPHRPPDPEPPRPRRGRRARSRWSRSPRPRTGVPGSLPSVGRPGRRRSQRLPRPAGPALASPRHRPAPAAHRRRRRGTRRRRRRRQPRRHHRVVGLEHAPRLAEQDRPRRRTSRSRLQPNVEVLVGERPIERMLVEPLDVHGLTLMPALARSGPGGVAIETTTTAETRLAELGSRFDAEIIVGAPVLTSAESIELCPLVDARDRRVRSRRTPPGSSSSGTLELLSAVGDRRCSAS